MWQRSDNNRRVKCDASCEVVVFISSSVGSELAVVSQRPGSWGEIGLGSIDVDVGVGICNDNESVGVRWIWAILEFDMLLNRVEIAFARLDCSKIC